MCNCGHRVSVAAICNRRITAAMHNCFKPRMSCQKGVWGRISAPQGVSEGDLSNPNSHIVHPEISPGCESAGFQLGVSWPVEILGASREC